MFQVGEYVALAEKYRNRGRPVHFAMILACDIEYEEYTLCWLNTDYYHNELSANYFVKA